MESASEFARVKRVVDGFCCTEIVCSVEFLGILYHLPSPSAEFVVFWAAEPALLTEDAGLTGA